MVSLLVRVCLVAKPDRSATCAWQDDPKYKQAMRTRNPEQRLRAFLALCGSKRFDEETGAPQPAYRMDSMRLMAEFPKPKGVSISLFPRACPASVFFSAGPIAGNTATNQVNLEAALPLRFLAWQGHTVKSCLAKRHVAAAAFLCSHALVPGGPSLALTGGAFIGQDDEDLDMGAEVERRQEITAEKAHEILKRISDEDCIALGFNPKFARPDWMIMTVFPVPPPPVRPSVMMDSSARCCARYRLPSIFSALRGNKVILSDGSASCCVPPRFGAFLCLICIAMERA
jgi:DNA-directed RNA polymerase beta' subunit